MEKDKQAHETKKKASISRRVLEAIGLKSIVLYEELIEKKEDIGMGCREPHYQWTDIVRFTQNGKTLYVKKRLPNLGFRKKEKQTITPVSKPDDGTYTISFNGKTTEPIHRDADAIIIKGALTAEGLLGITVKGNMDTQIILNFGGDYANKHQLPVVVNSSWLTKWGNPLKFPPKVERHIPTKNYCIAQQEWGKQLFVLLKEDPGTHERKPVPMVSSNGGPAIYSFFTKEWRLIPGGIEVQRTKTSRPERFDNLRQK